MRSKRLELRCHEEAHGDPVGTCTVRGLHLQVWLGVADLPNAMPFAVMCGLQGVARALPLTILPLTALEIMGSAQEVSLLYFCASFVGLAGSLSMPLLVHLIRRRRVVALGTVLICLAAALLSLGSGIVFAAGLTCFLVGFIAIDISLNLHLMDHIPRQEFGRFETVRVLFVGSGFIIGPMAGVWLSQAFGHPAPFIAMAVVTLIVYAVCLYLRFSDNKAIQAAKTSPPNPLKFFPHFFQQPRLRLA